MCHRLLRLSFFLDLLNFNVLRVGNRFSDLIELVVIAYCLLIFFVLLNENLRQVIDVWSHYVVVISGYDQIYRFIV